MKRNLILLLLSLVIAVTASAADYVYVKANSVNLRAKPSTSSSKLTTLYCGEVLHSLGRDGDWVSVIATVFNEITFKEENKKGYVNAAYVEPIENSPVPESIFGKEFVLLNNDTDVTGYLAFERSGSNIDYTYRVVSREMQRSGGSGTLDFGSGSVTYAASSLSAVNDNPTIYDATRGILYLGGMLWKEQ